MCFLYTDFKSVRAQVKTRSLEYKMKLNYGSGYTKIK